MQTMNRKEGVGQPKIKWSNDFSKAAGFKWNQIVQNEDRSRNFRETYIKKVETTNKKRKIPLL